MNKKRLFIEVFTGNKKSERHFADYFLGIPSAYRDDAGNKIQLNLAGRTFAWMAYILGGFIVKPLQSVAKCIFEVPLVFISNGCRSIFKKKTTTLIGFVGKFLAFIVLRNILTTTELIRYALIRPILSPIDNIKYALGLKNKSYRRLLLVISATVTTLFYGSFIALTAGFALPLIAPNISVSVLSTMISGFSSLLSASTVTIGAIATAITSIPLVASVINGIQTAKKYVMRSKMSNDEPIEDKSPKDEDTSNRDDSDGETSDEEEERDEVSSSTSSIISHTTGVSSDSEPEKLAQVEDRSDEDEEEEEEEEDDDENYFSCEEEDEEGTPGKDDTGQTPRNVIS